MRVHLAHIVAAATLALAASAPSLAAAADADDAVLAEVNYAREYPQAYAMRLLLQPVSSWEEALGADHAAADPGALYEAVNFLMRQSPLSPLQKDDKLAAAALEHVADQGERGAIGHDSPSGEHFDDRIRRHGVAAAVAAENIAYGPSAPDDVVRELIIDSGVPSRGHRRNIFYGPLLSAGVSCGPHKAYAAMCVMDFAGRPLQTASWRQAEAQAPRQATGGVFSRLFGGLW